MIHLSLPYSLIPMLPTEHPDIPSLIEPLLTEYLASVRRDLPDLMAACYLHGSLALGAFNEHRSDIDFITVVNRRCTPDEFQMLTLIHQQLEAQYPHWPLQGSYLQWADLGQFAKSIDPGSYYSDGVLHSSGHHDINSVTWWLLKHRGIALVGPEPQTLEFSVDWPLLVHQMHENLNSYWVTFTRKPARIAWLYSDYGVQWTVLGVLRQYYTFREDDITSKIGAGEYALTHVPEKWRRIIREAINIRGQATGSLYTSRLVRAVAAFRFLRFIIQSSNTYYAGKSHTN